MTSLLPLLQESTTSVYENSHVNLKIDDVVFPSGIKGKHARFQVKSGHGVAFVAKKIVRGTAYYALQSEHRYAIDRYSLEFPRSSTSADDDFEAALTAFKTEAEMTHVSDDPLKIGTLYPDTGVMTNTVNIYLINAQDNRNVFDPHEDDDAIRWMTSGEINGAIMTGRIFCGITLSVWAMIQASSTFAVGEEYR